MATMVQDVVTHFTTALDTFTASSSGVITTYVMPLGWTILAIGLLVHSWAIIEGKVQAPLQDWMFKLVAALMVLYAMSGGYLNWIADPLYNLGDELGTLLAGGGSAVNSLAAVNDKVLNLISATFSAAGESFKFLDFGSGSILLIFGILIGIACYLLIGTALFFIIFAKMGISLVLAVGPFFVLGLLNQHTRSYFFSWLNTALYFVFYQVLTVLFIILFIGILNNYMTALEIKLSGATWTVQNAMLNMMGLGGPGTGANLVATLTPVIVISIAMFFMLMQLPTIASSITSGSGGAFGNGLYAMSQVFRSRGGKGGGDKGGGNGSGGNGGGNASKGLSRSTPSSSVTLPAPKA